MGTRAEALPKASNKLECPACASADIEKLSELYEAGGSITVSAGSIPGTGGGSAGPTGGGHGSTPSSRFAEPITPPWRRVLDGRFGAYLGVMLALAGCYAFYEAGALGGRNAGVLYRPFLFVAVGWLAALIGAFVLRAKERPAHESRLAQWRRSYVCGRCGAIFELDEE